MQLLSVTSIIAVCVDDNDTSQSYGSQKKMVKLYKHFYDWSLHYLMTVFKLQWLCSIKPHGKMNMTVNKMI
jgi:hypothetical protein